MNTQFKYVGSEKNLGRFGTVLTNETIELDDAESAAVKGNADFEPLGAPVAAVTLACVEDGASVAIRARLVQGEYITETLPL